MQKQKLPSLVTLLILTMLTTVMWVGFSIYRAFTQAPQPAVPPEISEPLNPNLDTATLGKIESALFFTESQIPAISTSTPKGTSVPVAVETPVASPTESPTGSPIATPVETPTATPTP